MSGLITMEKFLVITRWPPDCYIVVLVAVGDGRGRGGTAPKFSSMAPRTDSRPGVGVDAFFFFLNFTSI